MRAKNKPISSITALLVASMNCQYYGTIYASGMCQFWHQKMTKMQQNLPYLVLGGSSREIYKQIYSLSQKECQPEL